MPTSGHLARGRRMPLALFAALVALLSLGATSAYSATVTAAGGVITYTAANGEDNDLVVTDDGTNYVFTDDVPVTPGAGCAEDSDPNDPNQAVCPKAANDEIVINLGDVADTTTFTGIGDFNDGFLTVTQNGGAGADVLGGTQGGELNSNGDADNDTLNSFTTGTFEDGGVATLDGGTGDRDIHNGAPAGSFTRMINSDGGDDFNNGAGFDEVDYSTTPGPITVTLDGQANDGRANEADNVGTVDHVIGSAGDDTLTGSEGNNGGFFGEEDFRRVRGVRGGFGFAGIGLSGGAGNDTINGLGGADSLNGDDGNDTLNGGAGRDNTDGGAGDDTINGGADADPFLFGGAGNDTINGEGGNDGLLGSDGNDTLNGGDGGDGLTGGAGSDGLFGNADFDTGNIDADDDDTGDPRDVTVTLDDQANDGRAGENDNYHSDIEDLNVNGDGRANITGSAQFNRINTDIGADTVDGVAGSDLISTSDGDDTVNARDGSNDRIDCGAGNDTANIDQFDEVTNCERVFRENVAAANADRNPQVSFAAPASNATLPANTPTRVVVNASDDRSVSRVILLDEDRTVGTDTTAPYEFSYQATGDDVGKNTLVAVAVDASENASNAIRNVRVNRFRPNIRGVIRPARDRTAPFRFRVTGGITLPRFVTRAQGCRTGFVSVQVKRRTRTISTRRVKIKRTCGFSSTVTFRNTRRLGNGRLKFTVRWLGNAVLAPRTARSVNVRAG